MSLGSLDTVVNQTERNLVLMELILGQRKIQNNHNK